MNTLFTLLQLPREGLGEVVFAESLNDPLPLGFELLLGHIRPASSLFSAVNKKKSAGARSGE
jgi:hypothetical protein